MAMLTRRDLAMINKVPEVTLAFWTIKIMATTVGETAADFLSVTLNLGLTVTSLFMAVLLVGALLLQLRSRRYVPWLYWITVVFVSVVGTLITDNLSDNFGISLIVTTSVFAAALAATFSLWYAKEGTLSIHTIVTTRRELFYWAAVLFTFALGTAAGDLTAERLQLGYAPSALIFGTLIGLVTICYFVLRLNAVVAFWIAYVLTRPFGASCGDLLAQSRSDGGLGLGTITTSFVFLVIITGLVAWLTIPRGRRMAGTEMADG
jgi:uncharacterized membrane-anchored protein